MYNIESETGAFYSVGEEGMNGYVVIKYVCPLSTNQLWTRVVPDSIEWYIEDQVFSPSYDSAPPPPSFSLSSQQVVSLFLGLPVWSVTDRAYWRESGGRGWRRSQSKRWRESLVFYKSLKIVSGWFWPGGGGHVIPLAPSVITVK